MRKIIIWLVMMLLLLLTSCSRDALNLESPNDALLEFLQSTTDTYTGDDNYFHVVKAISSETSDSVKLSGEVKNNSTSGSKSEYEFEVTCTVIGNRMIQTIEGSRLNDSDFNEVTILEAPIEIGHKWHYKAVNKVGNKVAFNAEIIDVWDNGNAVKVKYESKDGYREERTIFSGRGTIDFVKEISYKGTSIITGYHSTFSSESEANSEVPVTTEVETSLEAQAESMPMVSINIPVSIYNLLLGFNQSWDSFIKDGDEAIWKLVELESPAVEKLDSIDITEDKGYRFYKFYAYEIHEEKPYVVVSIVETYVDDQNNEMRNKVTYWISNTDTVPKIYDFSGN